MKWLLAKWVQGSNYPLSILLVSLFVLIAVEGVTDAVEPRESGFPVVPILLDVLMIGVLLIAVHAIGIITRRKWLLLVLLVLPVAASLFARYFAGTGRLFDVVVIGLHIFVIVFYSYVMLVILAHVLRGGTVTIDEINGAVCVYLLLGITGGFMFSLIEFVWPNSFNYGDLFLPQWDDVDNPWRHREELSVLMYHSLVTLTTLGYGDVTPVSPPARVTASLLAVSGQVYLAVLVARLVGLHISLKSAGSAPEDEPVRHDPDHAPDETGGELHHHRFRRPPESSAGGAPGDEQ